MEIIWSRFAKITFLEILENIQERWTTKEVQQFVNLTDQNLSKLFTGKLQWPFIDRKRGIQKLILYKIVSLYYKEIQDKEIIFLVAFIHNRMDPKRIKRLLQSK